MTTTLTVKKSELTRDELLSGNFNYDRSAWARGEWDEEPDVKAWTSPDGYRCVILRTSMGHLCGYVGVPEGHPLYGKDYSNYEGFTADFHVHGGITYSARENDGWYYFGFDCAHSGDLSPSMVRDYRQDVYRNMSYVEAEVNNMAAQVREMISAYRDHIEREIEYLRGELKKVDAYLNS